MPSVFFNRPDPLKVRRQQSGLYWVTVWWPTLFAMGIIAMESTAKFSAGNTSSWLRPVFEHWLGPINDSHWQIGHHVFRKTGHLAGYGFVGLTFLRAWLYTLSRRLGVSTAGWRIQSCTAAVLCTAVVASMDEWHQTSLPSRTGTISDVGIDSLGAILMCATVWLILWRGSSATPDRREQSLSRAA
jgi:VanZ family protein